MVLKEDTHGCWLSAEKNNGQTSPERLNAVQTFLSNQDIVIRKGVLSYMTKKPTSTMLIEAIRALNNDERGASVPAITKWISGNYVVSSMDKLKLQIKKAVLRALNTGVIERSEASKGSMGSGGSFVLGKETKMKSSGKKLAKSTKGVSKSKTKNNVNTSELQIL